jgi:hypothetical protein
VREVEKSRFAEKLIRLVNVDNDLVAVIGKPRYFHFAVNNQVDAGGRLVLVVDHLAFAILHDAGAW